MSLSIQWYSYDICSYTASPTSQSSTLSLHDALPISAVHGEAQWNGVAILSRVGLGDVTKGLPGAPGFPDPEARAVSATRSEEHTSELQSRFDLVCRLLLEKKNYNQNITLNYHN